MDQMTAALLVVALFGGVLGGLARIASKARQRGGGASFMGPFEEAWHPAAHRARIETLVQQEQPAPEPAPGDRLV